MRTIVNNTSLPGFFAATAMPDPDWWQALWREPEKVFAALGVPSGLKVVDLCCGDGLFTVPLAHMSRHVIGIDIDPGMLALTRAKLIAGGATNCDLIEGDAYAIAELVRMQVHFVLMANTFHGVPDKPRLVRAVAAVLKPGGEFAVINWHRWPREETTVLGKPRGPKTDIRMEPPERPRLSPAPILRLRASSNCHHTITARYSGEFDQPRTIGLAIARQLRQLGDELALALKPERSATLAAGQHKLVRILASERVHCTKGRDMLRLGGSAPKLFRLINRARQVLRRIAFFACVVVLDNIEDRPLDASQATAHGG